MLWWIWCHPLLVECVESLGSNSASDKYASLKIFETVDTQYMIVEYNGIEEVKTRTKEEWYFPYVIKQ